MTTSTTFLTLRQDVARSLSQILSDKLAQLPVPLVTTALGTSSVIAADKLVLGTQTPGGYDGYVVEIVELVGAGPAVKEYAAVVSGGLTSNSIQVSPPYTKPVQDGTSLILYPPTILPELVERKLNQVLEETEGIHLWFPSLVDDSDMSSAALANWAAVDTPTTRAFDTGGANVLFGPRALKIISDAADEGAACNSFPVTQGEALYIFAFVRAVAQSVKVILRNASAGSDIKTVTVDEQLFTEVMFSESVPTGMELAALRFLSDASGAEFYVSPPVVVQSSQRMPYKAPSWLVSEDQILATRYLPQGMGSVVSDSYLALAEPSRIRPNVGFLRDDQGVNPSWVVMQNFKGRPIFLVVSRAFAALSALTDTTTANRNYVVEKTIAHILRDRGDDRWVDHWARAASLAKSAGYSKRKVSIESRRTMVL